jgi:hypothetical protein
MEEVCELILRYHGIKHANFEICVGPMANKLGAAWTAAIHFLRVLPKVRLSEDKHSVARDIV